jgi:hypothetical protein
VANKPAEPDPVKPSEGSHKAATRGPIVGRLHLIGTTAVLIVLATFVCAGIVEFLRPPTPRNLDRELQEAADRLVAELDRWDAEYEQRKNRLSPAETEALLAEVETISRARREMFLVTGWQPQFHAYRVAKDGDAPAVVAVARAMAEMDQIAAERFRPYQPLLTAASALFGETPMLEIGYDAWGLSRSLQNKGIKADFGEILEGGIWLVKHSHYPDRGSPGSVHQVQGFRSYAWQYEHWRQKGLERLSVGWRAIWREISVRR